MSLQDDLNELQQKKDSRPPMIKYGDRPGNTIPNNDMNNNLDNVTVFGDVSADAAQISLDSANDAYESKQSAETLLALVTGTVDLPDFTVPNAPLLVAPNGEGVLFGDKPLKSAAFLDSSGTIPGSTAPDADRLPTNYALSRRPLPLRTVDFHNIADTSIANGLFPFLSNQDSENGPIAKGSENNFFYITKFLYHEQGNHTLLLTPYLNHVSEFRVTRYNGTFGRWIKRLDDQNTTTDSNGFVKTASPIIQLYDNQIIKTECLEIADTQFERVDVGHYVLHNAPLLSREGWYIETPKDRNNNIYFTLDYEERDGELHIKTYEPDYSGGRAENGDPVDILEGRYVSLRFAENPDLYPDVEM